MMGSTLLREKWWLLLNTISLLAFLVLASKTWIEPELKGVQAASGGAGVVWALTALPVLVGMILIDLVWFARAVIRAVKLQDRRPMFVALATSAVWSLAVLYDQLRH